MKVLLLSGYDAGSHKRWRTGLVAYFSEHQWTVLALPARRFSWRYVGNAYSWYSKNQSELQQDYDLLICTSMVNLTALRAIQPHIANIPTVLYFHENQFAYPIQHSIVQREVFHLCMQSIYSSICADTLIFNSEFNRTSFFQGARKLLKSMPDFAPRSEIQKLESRSHVLPVPINENLFSNSKRENNIPYIVWNHRWEYDKGPDRLYKALKKLVETGIEFKISIVGQRFASIPIEFEQLNILLGDRLIQFGYMDSKEQYHQLLQQSNIVISTAIHEFQGLAMLEAIAFGNTPIAPNRLAYPEYIPKGLLYQSVPEDQDSEAQFLFDKILEVIQTPETVDVVNYSASQIWPKYKDILKL